MKIYIQSDTGHIFKDKALTKPYTCNKKHSGNALIKENDGTYSCSQAHIIYLNGREIEQ